VLELPFRNRTGELPYMFAATLHRQPLVNGYSGHIPAAYRRLRAICCWPVPDELALAELRRMDVSMLLVHPSWEKRWSYREYDAWVERVQAGEIPGVRQLYADESGDRVFALDAR
ncbi:MAG TPA: hypothetical protein VKU40_07430, partial [Thermoanaerobaculia bacterium]|nr:hypothetical protein [Thermoanaerobaculia bacterium]